MLVPVSELPADSRVWIYQSTRPFTEVEAQTIQTQLLRFVDQWTSHSRELRGSALVLHQRFVVLIVDEKSAGASGCSIDASVRFMKHLEEQYGVDLFDRLHFSYRTADGRAQTLNREAFAGAYADGTLTDATPVFDTLVKTKGELETRFLKPLGESWHARMV